MKFEYVSPSMKLAPFPTDFSALRNELMNVYEFMPHLSESDTSRYRKAIEDVLIALQDYERDLQKIHICRKSPFEALAGARELGGILDR